MVMLQCPFCGCSLLVSYITGTTEIRGHSHPTNGCLLGGIFYGKHFSHMWNQRVMAHGPEKDLIDQQKLDMEEMRLKIGYVISTAAEKSKAEVLVDFGEARITSVPPKHQAMMDAVKSLEYSIQKAFKAS